MSSNSLNLTNVRNAIYNNLYLINENGGVDNIRDLLSSDVSQDDIDGLISVIASKATINNPRFTGNVGINTLTADSALHIVGSKRDDPTTTGIRMGKSSNFVSGASESYGIEICSDSSVIGGSYIDFTYPIISNFPNSFFMLVECLLRMI